MKRTASLCISICLSFILWLLNSGKMLFYYLLNKRQKIKVIHCTAEEDGAYELLHFLRTHQENAEKRAGLLKEILRKKKRADLLRAELNSEGRKELLKTIPSRLLDQSNISTGDAASYARAQFNQIKIILGQLLSLVFNIVFRVLVIPFYYLIFFPIAKLTLLFEHKRSR